jgi:adenylate kinase
MIALFGAPGSGKSLQGQLLAARHDWRWLSTGQILRDSGDPEILQLLKNGKMIDDTVMFPLITASIQAAKNIKHLILDGFPRTEAQVKWLFDSREDLGRELGLVIHLVVPEEELDRRLSLRGRADDRAAEREYRQNFYEHEMADILKVFNQHKVNVIRIDGDGTVGTVHDRIEEVLDQCLPA